MNDRNERLTKDARLDAVLAALAEARPQDGLHERMLQRLSDGAGPASRTEAGRGADGWLRPRFVFPAAVAACVLCVAGALLHHATRGGSLQDAPIAIRQHSISDQVAGAADKMRQKLSSTASAATPEYAPGARVRRPVRCGVPACGMGASGRLETALASASSAGAAHEASFPAPEMPLTEQERLLLQIAHRNDPVELAMLDPVERNREFSKERAQTAHFFTPPPLPSNLQHEIDAALRSQYVNTPLPDELK
ncbi:hypothetical protein [Terriglobus sp.]|uniref:hypothetical protein n=1 Tax=Terriglobus sp. TaxID=1889013 RepID=UPI003B005F2A